MGCDIHGVVQMRHSDLPRWNDVACIDSGRNYRLFSALAGVRQGDDDEPMIAEPRGLPSDFTMFGDEHPLDYPKAMIWMGDHSFSWLTLDEIETWPGWTDERRANVGEQFFAWIRWLRLKCGKGRSARIVFGFDN